MSILKTRPLWMEISTLYPLPRPLLDIPRNWLWSCFGRSGCRHIVVCCGHEYGHRKPGEAAIFWSAHHRESLVPSWRGGSEFLLQPCQSKPSSARWPELPVLSASKQYRTSDDRGAVDALHLSGAKANPEISVPTCHPRRSSSGCAQQALPGESAGNQGTGWAGQIKKAHREDIDHHQFPGREGAIENGRRVSMDS